MFNAKKSYFSESCLSRWPMYVLCMLVFVFSSYDLHTSFMFFMKYVTLAFNPIRGRS